MSATPMTIVPAKERTDEEKVLMAPLKIKLGEKDYLVKIHRMGEAPKWREKLFNAMKEINAEMSQTADGGQAFLTGLGFVLLRFPDKMAKLVYAYAPDLPADVIETEATEEQLATAFGQIVRVAFPFRGELQMISQILGTTATSPR